MVRFPLVQRSCAVAFLLGALAAAGCGSSTDPVSWMNILSFRSNGVKVGGLATDPTVETTDLLDVEIENATTSDTADGIGTGLTVQRVQLHYRMGTISMPTYVHQTPLYLPAPPEDGTTSGLLRDVPMVTPEFKQFLLTLGARPFSLEADVIVSGLTDEGTVVTAIDTITVLVE